jgi:predicted DNA-binding ribbon-helix-helix protein
VLRKRSITLSGHPTSLALEPEFWTALEAMAKAERASVAALIGRIDRSRAERPLASACRVAALNWAFREGAAGNEVRASAAG